MSGTGTQQLDEARIVRVESEVSTIRNEMGSLTREVTSLTADVKGLGAILGRIESGVARAQERNDEREHAGKPNLAAVVSILITIISILVGGAWLVSGNLSKQDERAAGQEKLHAMFVEMRNREADIQNRDIRALQDQVTTLHRDRAGAAK